jgi:GNAT superfamily N-acetyltransferase
MVIRLSLPAPEWGQLTFPAYRSLLAKDDGTLAVGARRHGEPVGLGVAAVHAESGSAAVLSIAVAPHCRRQGVGTALLRALEAELPPECSRLGAVLTEKTAALPVLKEMLERDGWSAPTERMLICQTNLNSMLQAPWMHPPALPPAFTIFPWSELGEPEAAAVREKRELDYPDGLSPFKLDEPFDPVSSLGLRFEGKVAGWIITHLLPPAALRYSVMFVREDLQRRARAVPLLVESIRRVAARPLTREVGGCFAVNIANAPMMAFVRRRLQPHMTSMYHSYHFSKTLTGAPAEAPAGRDVR